MCYFCIKGHTTGIAHTGKKKAAGPPVLVRVKCNKRKRVEKCADVKERVDIQKGGDYCKMCYRKLGKGGTKNERKKKCNKSRLGCPICREHICEDCWNSGYDMHKR